MTCAKSAPRARPLGRRSFGRHTNCVQQEAILQRRRLVQRRHTPRGETLEARTMERYDTSGAMNRLRILVLGSDCHPTKVSIPYVTYSHAAALAQLHDVTLVALPHVEEDVRRAGAPFRAIEIVKMPRALQGIRDFLVRSVRPDSQIKTAFGYPFAMAFEWQAWRQLRHRIAAREFDVVLRVLPMSAVVP